MPKYTIPAPVDENTGEFLGGRETLTGSLHSLMRQLKRLGYTGSTIRVLDDAGWTRGWVNADHWSAQ